MLSIEITKGNYVEYNTLTVSHDNIEIYSNLIPINVPGIPDLLRQVYNLGLQDARRYSNDK